MDWINSTVNLAVEGCSYKLNVMEDLLQTACGQRLAKGGQYSESESENEAEDEVDGRSELSPESDAASGNDSLNEPLDNHKPSRNLTLAKMGESDNSVDYEKEHTEPQNWDNKLSNSDNDAAGVEKEPASVHEKSKEISHGEEDLVLLVRDNNISRPLPCRKIGPSDPTPSWVPESPNGSLYSIKKRPVTHPGPLAHQPTQIQSPMKGRMLGINTKTLNNSDSAGKETAPPPPMERGRSSRRRKGRRLISRSAHWIETQEMTGGLCTKVS